ncbi:MAG: hypothetical protein WD069_10315 [Planctomycetales bacterium]
MKRSIRALFCSLALTAAAMTDPVQSVSGGRPEGEHSGPARIADAHPPAIARPRDHRTPPRALPVAGPAWRNVFVQPASAEPTASLSHNPVSLESPVFVEIVDLDRPRQPVAILDPFRSGPLPPADFGANAPAQRPRALERVAAKPADPWSAPLFGDGDAEVADPRPVPPSSVPPQLLPTTVP